MSASPNIDAEKLLGAFEAVSWRREPDRTGVCLLKMHFSFFLRDMALLGFRMDTMEVDSCRLHRSDFADLAFLFTLTAR